MAQTRKSKRAATWWALTATVAIGILIAVLTLMPVAGGVPGSDKLYHVLAFAALAFPLSAVRASYAPITILAVLGYGAGIEVVQPFVGRSAELADFGADAFGAAIGAGAGLLVGLACRKAGRARTRSYRAILAGRPGPARGPSQR